MQDATGSWTWKKLAPTPTTTPPSGLSTDESSKQCERLLGELESLMAGDPYWGICVALWRLLSRKRGYYGCGEDPLANAKGVAEDGILPWRYQLARIGEKRRRLQADLGTLGIRKTLMDIAGHAVVALALLEEGTEE